ASSAGAIMPAATAEAFRSPGSRTRTEWPRRVNSTAVHRPRTPAPMIRMSVLEIWGRSGTGCQSTPHAGFSTRPNASGRNGQSAFFIQSLDQSLVLAPQCLGQTVAELLVEGRDQRGFLAPDLGVHVQQQVQVRVRQAQARQIEGISRRHATDRRVTRRGLAIQTACDPFQDARVVAKT